MLDKTVTPLEAAALFHVAESDVLEWIHEQKVAYLLLEDGTYLLPLSALISTLPDLFDLAGTLREAEQVIAASGLSADDLARIASGS